MTMMQKIDAMLSTRGLKRTDLSRGAGIPYTTIVGLYEKGVENVKLSTLKKIANFFGCSLDYLADDNCSDENPVLSAQPDIKGVLTDALKEKGKLKPGTTITQETADRLINIIGDILETGNR